MMADTNVSIIRQINDGNFVSKSYINVLNSQTSQLKGRLLLLLLFGVGSTAVIEILPTASSIKIKQRLRLLHVVMYINTSRKPTMKIELCSVGTT